MVKTLGAFLERGGNYDATTQALGVHRSTLKYRLHRIEEISGHDLAQPDVRFNLQLAIRAAESLRALSR
jgi:DNA-binding PucR family transcriptional regulator